MISKGVFGSFPEAGCGRDCIGDGGYEFQVQRVNGIGGLMMMRIMKVGCVGRPHAFLSTETRSGAWVCREVVAGAGAISRTGRPRRYPARARSCQSQEGVCEWFDWTVSTIDFPTYHLSRHSRCASSQSRRSRTSSENGLHEPRNRRRACFCM